MIQAYFIGGPEDLTKRAMPGERLPTFLSFPQMQPLPAMPYKEVVDSVKVAHHRYELTYVWGLPTPSMTPTDQIVIYRYAGIKND